MPRQQVALPAFGLGVALELGIGGDHELQPDVAGLRLAGQVALGQRQRLGRLLEGLVGLDQHLQAVVVEAGGARRKQLDHLGVAAFGVVEAGQVIALLSGLRRFQLAAGQRLLQRLDGAAAVALGPGQIAAAAPQQGLLQRTGRGLDAVQRAARGLQVAALLGLLGLAEGAQHAGFQGLRGPQGRAQGQQGDEQQTTHFNDLLAADGNTGSSPLRAPPPDRSRCAGRSASARRRGAPRARRRCAAWPRRCGCSPPGHRG